MNLEPYYRAYPSRSICQTGSNGFLHEPLLGLRNRTFKAPYFKAHGSLGMGKEIVLLFNWTPFLTHLLFLISTFWPEWWERITPGFKTLAILEHRSDEKAGWANCGPKSVSPQSKDGFCIFKGGRRGGGVEEGGGEVEEEEEGRGRGRRICDRLWPPGLKYLLVLSVCCLLD